MINSLGCLIAAAALWGCTNPFIKRGTKGIRSVRADTRVGQCYAELTFLLTNWEYVLPFLVNQLGSILYFLALQGAQLSLAVPVTNSLSFVFTALTGWIIGEEPLTARSMLGIFFIIVGTTVCYSST